MRRTYVVYTRATDRGPLRANSSWNRLGNAQERARGLEELGYDVAVVPYLRDQHLPVEIGL